MGSLRVLVPQEGVLMKASSPKQCAEITEIVGAIHEVSYWRAGVLMDQFVQEADLADLCALRQALNEEASRPERP